MVDAAPLGWKDDWAFVDFLARQVGVLAVPGSSFYTARRRQDARARQLREEGRDAAGSREAPRRRGSFGEGIAPPQERRGTLTGAAQRAFRPDIQLTMTAKGGTSRSETRLTTMNFWPSGVTS